MQLLTFFDWQEYTNPQKQSPGGILQKVAVKNFS